MKSVLLAVAMAAAVGCGSSQIAEPTPSGQQAEQSYAEALQVYRLEKEAMDELQDDRRFFAEALDRYDEGLEELIRERAVGRTNETEASIRANLGPDILEDREEIWEESKADVAETDAKIAKQKIRLDRAKADLEAAESQRK